MNTTAASGIDALVLLMDYPHAAVLPGILIADLTRPVGTAVIQEQQLKVLKRLTKNAFNALP